MRITYALLNAYATGGTVRTVFNQASALARKGHDVEVLSVVRTGKRIRFPYDRRVEVSTLAGRGWPYEWVWDKVMRRLRTPAPGNEVPEEEYLKGHFTAKVERLIIDAFARLDTDVLVTTRPGLNLLAARYAGDGLLKVGQEHQKFTRYKGRLREAILRDYSKLDVIVTLTEFDRRKYTAAFGDRLRVTRIPNALHSLDVPQSDRTGKVVIAAGRLVRQKGFDRLIPAFAQVAAAHPDWTLKIFGDGPKVCELRDLIDAHGMRDHIHLMGRTDRLEDELARASIFAMSSRTEGFGMVVIEAMSQGLPVVSFHVTGPDEILSHEHDGLLVPAGDVDAFAAGIRRLIEDPRLRETMGRHARENAQKYGPGSVTREWDRLFAAR